MEGYTLFVPQFFISVRCGHQSFLQICGDIECVWERDREYVCVRESSCGAMWYRWGPGLVFVWNQAWCLVSSANISPACLPALAIIPQQWIQYSSSHMSLQFKDSKWKHHFHICIFVVEYILLWLGALMLLGSLLQSVLLCPLMLISINTHLSLLWCRNYIFTLISV